MARSKNRLKRSSHTNVDNAASPRQIVYKGAHQGDQIVARCLRAVGLRGKAFQSAFYISLPSAGLALLVRTLASAGILPWFNPDSSKFLEINTAVWTGITGVLGFLVVFRASQAYGRYWQAMTNVHLMRAEWFDACSAISSFCATSSDIDKAHKVRTFKQLLVRLFSILHASALLRLIECELDHDGEVDATMLPLLDPGILDKMSADAFHNTEYKVELVSQWIQHMIVKGVADGTLSAPPPIVSRSFQELANGMVKFHDALKVKTIAFPAQYAQVCQLLLGMHWLVTPFIIPLWVNSPFLATLFTFLAVFVFWSLGRVSATIENPFRLVSFLHDALDMQEELNNQLFLMLDPLAARVPALPGLRKVTLYSMEFPCTTLEEFSNAQCASVVVEHDTILQSVAAVTEEQTDQAARLPPEVAADPLVVQDIPEVAPSLEQGPPSIHSLQLPARIRYSSPKQLQTHRPQDQEPLNKDRGPLMESTTPSTIGSSCSATLESSCKADTPVGVLQTRCATPDACAVYTSPEAVSVQVRGGAEPFVAGQPVVVQNSPSSLLLPPPSETSGQHV